MAWYQNGVEGSTRILNLLKVYSQKRSYTSQQSTCGQHAMQDVKAMWLQYLMTFIVVEFSTGQFWNVSTRKGHHQKKVFWALPKKEAGSTKTWKFWAFFWNWHIICESLRQRRNYFVLAFKSERSKRKGGFRIKKLRKTAEEVV